ncbi:MAG: hypothetical protein KGD57_01965, partial [Candidatus Lokiarchaeota archaeon]|nr:hypothetical protein [Candidatus Lokiarchaeota archaeon]
MYILVSKNDKNRQFLLKISLLSLVIFGFFLPIIINHSGIINSNLDQFHKKKESEALKLANGFPNLFEGNLDALNITDFGKLYNNSQEISLTDQEEIDLLY